MSKKINLNEFREKVGLTDIQFYLLRHFYLEATLTEKDWNEVIEKRKIK